jgi:hypothetical protein
MLVKSLFRYKINYVADQDSDFPDRIQRYKLLPIQVPDPGKFL